jgi:hypothetical protein
MEKYFKKMDYLIVTDSYEPLLTNWYNPENFDQADNMVVFNLRKWEYTVDGKTWNEIKQDHL